MGIRDIALNNNDDNEPKYIKKVTFDKDEYPDWPSSHHNQKKEITDNYFDFYDPPEPGKIKIMVAIPQEDCGDIANPDSIMYNEDKMLIEAEEQAEDIIKNFSPELGKTHKCTILSEEGVGNINVTLIFSPLKK